MVGKVGITFADIQAEADVVSPQASVLLVTARTTFESVALQSVLTTVELRSAISFVDMRPDISYVNLVGTDYLLNSNLLLQLLGDSFTLSDSATFSFHYYRASADTVALVSATTRAVSKVLTDQFFFADAIVVQWTPIRLFTETVTPVDVLSMTVAKSMTETVNPTDVMALVFAKPVAETVTPTDVMTHAFSKGLTETFALTDSIIVTFAGVLLLADSVTMSDSASIFNTSIESSIPNHSVLGTFMLNH